MPFESLLGIKSPSILPRLRAKELCYLQRISTYTNKPFTARINQVRSQLTAVHLKNKTAQRERVKVTLSFSHFLHNKYIT